jgi:hypothetical protein
MEHGAKAHLKHLTEYFAFLNEFSKMGEEESQFLISVRAVSSMVNFYLGQKAQDYVSNFNVLLLVKHHLQQTMNFCRALSGELLSCSILQHADFDTVMKQ